jgi:hypothetical protein
LEQWLVEPGLVLVRDEQDLVIRRAEALRELFLADVLSGHDIGVHARLGVFESGLGTP